VRATDPAGRILIVSASMGAGHTATAAELEARLSRAGACVKTVDFLALPGGGEGDRLRRTYGTMIRRLPWAYGASMRLWARRPALMGAISARRTASFERALSREFAAFQPDVVVSTYNLASQSAGRIKAAGGGPRRLVTYVTDAGAHPYWVHPEADTHLAITRRTAEDLALLGARGCTTVAPLVRPTLASAAARGDEVREALGLGLEDRVALVNGGSWGVGSILGTVDLLAGMGELSVVVLCGRSEALRQRLAAWPGVLALGWLGDTAGVLGAADVVVDNAGGLTCLEALRAGVPVVLFRPLPGHGRLNAEALSAAGIATYARGDRALLDAVCEAEPVPDPFAGATDPAEEIWPPAPVRAGGLVRSASSGA
jgi:processive 1,2-diacylglycerol beta-glucosyltransferase